MEMQIIGKTLRGKDMIEKSDIETCFSESYKKIIGE